MQGVHSLESNTPCLEDCSDSESSSSCDDVERPLVWAEHHNAQKGLSWTPRGSTLLACPIASVVLLLACSILQRHGRPEAMKTVTHNTDSLVLVGSVPTHMRWLSHPNKCLDVAGTHNGAALQIWDCDPKYPYQQRFLVPPDGKTGRIQWAQNPSLCLDSPKKHVLQFWNCSEAPPENLLWSVSPDGMGRIHWAAHPDQCVDIPEENTSNGWKAQLWSCENTTKRGRGSNLRFVTHPVDCKWDAWEDWSPCSVTCGRGHHLRSRAVSIPAMNGGTDCGIHSHQSQHCNLVPCKPHNATGALAAWLNNSSSTTEGAHSAKPHRTAARSGCCGRSELTGLLAVLGTVSGMQLLN